MIEPPFSIIFAKSLLSIIEKSFDAIKTIFTSEKKEFLINLFSNKFFFYFF